jgi:peptide-methionine (R)-S-oxide reductase
MADQINKDLSDEQKRVLFQKGTESPGTGKFLNHNEKGEYTCANCNAVLFMSDDKYESTTPGLIGWPSFDTAVEGAITYQEDNSMFSKRTEINCTNCGVHLGHVFDADDAPSGTHFCVSSASLGFEPDKK